jgi:hypothetical protein
MIFWFVSECLLRISAEPKALLGQLVIVRSCDLTDIHNNWPCGKAPTQSGSKGAVSGYVRLTNLIYPPWNAIVLMFRCTLIAMESRLSARLGILIVT